MTTRWYVPLLVLLYPLYGCLPSGPWGGFGLPGWCVKAIRPDGQPIVGASVGLVRLPAGGGPELERLWAKL